MVFGYNICFEEYMNLLPRLVSNTTSKDRELMTRTERNGSKKYSNNNLTYSLIQQNIEWVKTLLLQRNQVFTILEAPYI